MVNIKLKRGQRKPRVVRATKKRVHTRTDLRADRKRKALRAGLRRSRTGNLYFESRDNRSDDPKTLI